MGDQRFGEFWVMRQSEGRGQFGQAAVRVVDRDSGPVVRWAVDPGDRGSVQPRTYPECVRAAADGAATGLALVAECGVPVDGLGVDIVEARIKEMDIVEPAVAAAAALAVTDAFGLLDRMGLGPRYDCVPHVVRVPGAGTIVDGLVRDVRDDDLRGTVAAVLNGEFPRTVLGVDLTVDGDHLTARGQSGAEPERVRLADFASALRARRWVHGGLQVRARWSRHG